MAKDGNRIIDGSRILRVDPIVRAMKLEERVRALEKQVDDLLGLIDLLARGREVDCLSWDIAVKAIKEIRGMGA